MSLLKAVFVMLIAVDLTILLLAVILGNPHLMFLFLIASALAKGWHNQMRIKQKISHFYKFKKENYASDVLTMK